MQPTLKCCAHCLGAVSDTSMSGASGSDPPAALVGPPSMCHPEGASTDTMGGGEADGASACRRCRRSERGGSMRRSVLSVLGSGGSRGACPPPAPYSLGIAAKQYLFLRALRP